MKVSLRYIVSEKRDVYNRVYSVLPFVGGGDKYSYI